jgi:hypothetical protein
MGVRNVAGEIGEDDTPGEGILPCATADADVLAVFGDPDAKDFEGGFVALFSHAPQVIWSRYVRHVHKS